MRPPKISRDELLGRCSKVFKRFGYHGTTMDALAAECELTKATLYHYYSNKESLMSDILTWSHERIGQALFSIAYDEKLPAAKRLALMSRKSKKLFQEGSIGCLMGVIAIDATYSVTSLVPQIRDFMDDWSNALAFIFAAHMDEPQASAAARQTVADYEGAILLSRIYKDISFFDRVSERSMNLIA